MLENIKKILLKPRILAILVVIVVASIFLWSYFNKYLLKSKAAQPKVSVNFLSDAASPLPLNTDHTVNMLISPDDKGNTISGFNITFNAGDDLQIVSVGKPEGVPKTDFTEIISNTSQIAYVVRAPTDKLPLTVSVPIVVKRVGPGQASISITSSKGQVVGPIAGYYYDWGLVGTRFFGPPITVAITKPPVSITGKPPIPSLTEIPPILPTIEEPEIPGTTITEVPPSTEPPVPGTISFNLKLRFQGITSVRKETLPVKVGLRGGNLPEIVYETGVFKSNDDGTWTGTVKFDNIIGAADYAIYIKGAKHLQKKICVATPSDRADLPNSYRCEAGQIHLPAGPTELDFSQVLLLSGDLPEQDGVVNSVDLAAIFNNFGKTDKASLEKSDINLDGVVNNQDYSLILSALGTKYDDGE